MKMNDTSGDPEFPPKKAKVDRTTGAGGIDAAR
jgi:hypothetical protein